jgi:hypothetical protein
MATPQYLPVSIAITETNGIWSLRVFATPTPVIWSLSHLLRPVAMLVCLF